MMESRPKWRISQNLAWEIPVDRRKAWPPQCQISKIGMPPFYGIDFTGRGGWSCERRCPSIDLSAPKADRSSGQVCFPIISSSSSWSTFSRFKKAIPSAVVLYWTGEPSIVSSRLSFISESMIGFIALMLLFALNIIWVMFSPWEQMFRISWRISLLFLLCRID